MQDPYRVLGVSRSSSDEDIKQAYRQKAAELAPDGYAGNPLSDIAQQKMDELNAAYDEIMSERRLAGRAQQSSERQQQQRQQSTGQYTPPPAGGYTYTTPEPQSATASGDFQQIRQMLNRNDISGAEHRLLDMPESARGAEWNFLMGSVCYAKGWLDEANRYYSVATNLDPDNTEYAAAKSRMNRQRQGQAQGNPYGGYNTTTARGCSGCNICTGLICADCCCECMGGDLIRCC